MVGDRDAWLGTGPRGAALSLTARPCPPLKIVNVCIFKLFEDKNNVKTHYCIQFKIIIRTFDNKY